VITLVVVREPVRNFGAKEEKTVKDEDKEVDEND